jgi:Rrf2 family transcriptional regulator, cysteine metabolism repressor
MKAIFVTPKIISQKCRYALRAIFELASHEKSDVIKISEIAAVQNIPPRFLENILLELKQAGFVTSRLGNAGGYQLKRSASELTVGEIILFVQGSLMNKFAMSENTTFRNGDYAFSNLWQRLNDSISDIYNNATFANLVNEEANATKEYVPDYVI